MAEQQEKLLELPEQAGSVRPAEPRGECKVKLVNRAQLTMAQIDVEHLIEEHHPGRGIWEVVQGLDVSKYEAAIRSRRGEVGRAAWPPQLMIAVWLYGYSRGVTSARELERQMEYEPGLLWLTGMEVINHHTLSDFRIEHEEALTELFSQMLVVLSDAGLVKMELVAHDGTKIRAQAGADSFRREATLKERLGAAPKLGKQGPQAEGGGDQRQQAAQQRARRERVGRAGSALEEMGKIQANLEEGKQKEPARGGRSEGGARGVKTREYADGPG